MNHIVVLILGGVNFPYHSLSLSLDFDDYNDNIVRTKNNVFFLRIISKTRSRVKTLQE